MTAPTLPVDYGITLSQLLEGLHALGGEQDPRIDSLTLDSRSVRDGSLFLACAGRARHGADFIPQALARGAVAVLCETDARWSQERIAGQFGSSIVPVIALAGLSEKVSNLAGRFYHHPSAKMHVIGVTGTNGKTSCTQFLASALQPDFSCAVIGTIGTGFPGRLEASSHTTPGPVELQALFADLLRRGADSVAMEVSSHALEQGRAAAIHFDVAVFTNLTRDHLDYHGTMAAYAASKRALFEMPGLACCVINADDAFGWELLEQLGSSCQCIGYGLQMSPQLQRLDNWLLAETIEPSLDGIRIGIRSSWGARVLQTSLLGRFNVSNLLAVLAVLLYRGISLDDAVSRLAGLRTVWGRMERFGGDGSPVVVVDYAHTPDALEQALAALREHVPGRLVCVFGCGGDRDRGKRPQMGAIAERLADLVYVTDDNPRTEDGGQIVQEILSGMENPWQARVERNRGEAIRLAIAAAAAGDLVLVAGKGHETVQLVGEQVLPFSDREQVAGIVGVAA